MEQIFKKKVKELLSDLIKYIDNKEVLIELIEEFQDDNVEYLELGYEN